MDFKGNKGYRLLTIHSRLNNGEVVNKFELAKELNVSVKTIQRDIEELRSYLSDTHLEGEFSSIEYSASKKGYYITREKRKWLTNKEVLALLKILLESRAFNKKELDSLISKLMVQVAPEDRETISKLIVNEAYHYVPLLHGKDLLDSIWELSTSIEEQYVIKFTYTRLDKTIKEHEVNPVAIMFSEYYFYLIAYLGEKREYPIVFRVDRMKDIVCTEKKFRIPYVERFQDGEFRKRVQFMYTGELTNVRFTCNDLALEAILDRLPTAQVKEKNEEGSIIEAEVFGKGLEKWLLSQGDNVWDVAVI